MSILIVQFDISNIPGAFSANVYANRSRQPYSLVQRRSNLKGGVRALSVKLTHTPPQPSGTADATGPGLQGRGRVRRRQCRVEPSPFSSNHRRHGRVSATSPEALFLVLHFDFSYSISYFAL